METAEIGHYDTVQILKRRIDKNDEARDGTSRASGFKHLHQHLRPLWDVIGITFDDCAIGKTEEDARLTTVD